MESSRSQPPISSSNVVNNFSSFPTQEYNPSNFDNLRTNFFYAAPQLLGQEPNLPYHQDNTFTNFSFTRQSLNQGSSLSPQNRPVAALLAANRQMFGQGLLGYYQVLGNRIARGFGRGAVPYPGVSRDQYRNSVIEDLLMVGNDVGRGVMKRGAATQQEEGVTAASAEQEGKREGRGGARADQPKGKEKVGEPVQQSVVEEDDDTSEEDKSFDDDFEMDLFNWQEYHRSMSEIQKFSQPPPPPPPPAN